MDLTEFIATTSLSFRGQLFKNKFGTSMGSPVSPILANFFMEWLEQQAIATATALIEQNLSYGKDM